MPTFLLGNNGLLQYGSNDIYRDAVTDLVVAEYVLRETTQREERLQYQTTALRKLAATDSDQADLEEADEQLQDIQLQYPRQEYALYQVTSALPWPFQESYHELRRNATWYMREHLVLDCADQGGCCSRQCGCCARRHLSARRKGRGHCTVECRCCIESRGFELSPEEKEERREHLVQRLKRATESDPDSIYLRRMARWTLTVPSVPPKQKSKPQLWWERLFN